MNTLNLLLFQLHKFFKYSYKTKRIGNVRIVIKQLKPSLILTIFVAGLVKITPQASGKKSFENLNLFDTDSFFYEFITNHEKSFLIPLKKILN